MDPLLRTFALASGLLFCVVFAAATVVVAAQNGIDLAVVLSLAIVALVMLGLVGAIRNPPRG